MIINQKKLESLWQYYRDDPCLDANGAVTNFSNANNKSALFKLK